MDELSIVVKNISKSFKVFNDRSYNLKERLIYTKRNRYEIHNVLKNISLSIKKGEAVGLIGRNGCGKSTTLKLLSRIMYPDTGLININGRVSALIELGAGFHPDMSGRENIYINAAIFGLSKKEIDERLESIIEFSELEEYIDNPVRTYSSGMYMRLAFSVAINVDADVLLIDEILAVGDRAFQNKCFDKLHEIKEKGTTIVIVSHSLEQIEEICDRTYWIKDGMIEMVGEPKKIHLAYLKYMALQAKGNGLLSINVEKGESNINFIENMATTNGEISEKGIVAKPGGIIFGPYLNVKEGRYHFLLEFEFPEEVSLVCRVTGESGEKEFFAFTIRTGINECFLNFYNEQRDIEFVIKNTQVKETVILKSIEMI